MQGLWAYLKTPVGILAGDIPPQVSFHALMGLLGIYGFLVVFWGAAIVLLLARWIDLHDPYLQVSSVAKSLPSF